MVLVETFGATGTGTAFFGGAWWILGLLLIIIGLTFLTAYRVSSDGMIIYMVLSILLVGFYQLFLINEQILQTILFFIFIFVGYLFYLWVTR